MLGEKNLHDFCVSVEFDTVVTFNESFVVVEEMK